MKLREIEKILVVEMSFPTIGSILANEHDLFIDITEYIYDKVLFMEGVYEIDQFNDIMKCDPNYLSEIQMTIDDNYMQWVLWVVHQQKEQLLEDYQDKFVEKEIEKIEKIERQLEEVL